MKVGDLVRIVTVARGIAVSPGTIGLIWGNILDYEDLFEVHFVGGKVLLGVHADDMEIIK
jgi:hypothetical protein